jgi:acyl dehydratase
MKPRDVTSPNNYFEDFAVGDVIRHARGKTVTEMDNVLITNMVMNTAEGHFNEHAMKTEMAGIPGFDTRIVFGGITLSMVIGLAAQDTAEQVLEELGMTGIRLRAPVKHGDTLYAYSEVLTKMDAPREDAGIVTFKHVGLNQDDMLVFEGERRVQMKRRSHWGG